MTRLASALCAVSALALFATPALAQSYDNEIVVGPPNVQRETTGRSASGARIETLSLTRVVSARDLNLRYDADVRELHRRIRDTAVSMCNEIDRSSNGLTITSDRQCVREAVRDAMVQADAMVYYARG
ncbi:MAG: UrcA family protein [Hyphomonadaceae bacterium]